MIIQLGGLVHVLSPLPKHLLDSGTVNDLDNMIASALAVQLSTLSIEIRHEAYN